MHIFAADIGLLRVMFKVIFDLVRLGIHPALHIADMAVCAVPEHALIVYQPGLVIPMKILRHRLYILSRIGFVSTGPDQDARMVLIPLEHRLRPVKDSAPPLGKVSRHMTGWVACPHLLPGAMAFQVGLIHQIDAVFIAQAIPQTLVWIMGCPYGIDIMLLQEPGIPQHILPGNGASSSGIKFMTVNSFE